METEATFLTLKTTMSRLVAPSEEEWRAFSSLFQERRLKQGDFFVRAGQASTELCFVNSGLLRFFYETLAGSEFNKSFVQEGEFAGAHSAYLTGMPSRFNIQVLEDSHLLVAELEDITALYDRDVCWQKLGRMLAEQLYIKKEQREAEFLLDDAETRYQHFQDRYPDLEGRLPQYHVASYIGITPVALSRIRSRSKINPG